jgi:hypothetical protein
MSRRLSPRFDGSRSVRSRLAFSPPQSLFSLEGSWLRFGTARSNSAVDSAAEVLNVVHQRPILGGRARAHFGKRAVIEHARDCIAGFDHDEADRARLEIAAILAGSKSGHRSTRSGSQGTIEGTHNRTHTNLMRRACESVASAFPFLGVSEARVSDVGPSGEWHAARSPQARRTFGAGPAIAGERHGCRAPRPRWRLRRRRRL